MLSCAGLRLGMQRVMMFRILFALALLSAPAAAADLLQSGDVAVQSLGDRTRFTLIGDSGHAGFTVPSAWQAGPVPNKPDLVLGLTVVDPQVHAATIFVSLSALHADDAKRRNIVVHSRYRNWDIVKSGLVIDAEGSVGGVAFHAEAVTLDIMGGAKLEATLDALLDSVDGGTDTYALHPDEIVRRRSIR